MIAVRLMSVSTCIVSLLLILLLSVRLGLRRASSQRRARTRTDSSTSRRQARSVQQILRVSRGTTLPVTQVLRRRDGSSACAARDVLEGLNGGSVGVALGSSEGVERLSGTLVPVEPSSADSSSTGRTDRTSRTSSGVRVEAMHLRHAIALASMGHGRLGVGAVAGVGIASVHAPLRGLISTTCAVSVVIVYAKVGGTSVGCGFSSGEGDIAVEFLGAATTNGVGNEGDDEDGDDEAYDGEDTSNGALVVEEAASRVWSDMLNEGGGHRRRK